MCADVTGGEEILTDADLDWLYVFLAHCIKRVRPETRALVRSLDLRPLLAAVSVAQFSVSMAGSSALLSRALSVFPSLACLLVDGHPDLDLASLAARPVSEDASGHPLLLLSIPRCQTELPAAFFASPLLRSLVYLDVSYLPGSLKTALAQKTLSPASLPYLRILKAQGREMDDATATLLFKVFGAQLWSVDLSRNRLTDAVFEDMNLCFAPVPCRKGDAGVEGSVMQHSALGTSMFGLFSHIRESKWSGTFNHPHRYLADAPGYSQDVHTNRLDGTVKIHDDSADAVKTLLSGGAGRHSPVLERIPGLVICQSPFGLTHLYLNGNSISAAALTKRMRMSPGLLQHLECDTPLFTIPEAARRRSWLASKEVKLWGILGEAHWFRSLVAPDLQVLRIHHSLVTQLLTLHIPYRLPMETLWLAETYLLPRAEMAYPQAFVPDMNPRLRSLTLTHIPRYSTGRLIEKLIAFLKLASIQERAVQDVRRSSSRRGPAVLSGLRHIRLEFQPDPRQTFEEDLNYDEELDFERSLTSFQEFSITDTLNWDSSLADEKPVAQRQVDPSPYGTCLPNTAPPASEPKESSPTQSVQLTPFYPYSIRDNENKNTMRHTWTYHGRTVIAPVFIGDGHLRPSNHPALNEYMRLLASGDADLLADPEPASPCHVAAGVPGGAIVFGAAWRGILATLSDRNWSALPTPPLLPRGMSNSSSSGNTGSKSESLKAGLGGCASGDLSSCAVHGCEGCAGNNYTTPFLGQKTCSSTGSGPTENHQAYISPQSHVQFQSQVSSPRKAPKPTRAQLAQMRDVVAAIKAYRAQTRAAYEEEKRKAKAEGREILLGEPHFHWMGSLEVVVPVGG